MTVKEWAEDVLDRLHRAELDLLRARGQDDLESIARLERTAINDRKTLSQALRGTT